MKKYFFVLAFFNFLMAGCWKTNVNPDHVNKFTCKVNGVFWEAVPLQRDILGNDLQMTVSPTEFGSIRASNAKKNQSITFNLSLKDTSKDFVITDDIPYGDYGRKCVGYFLDTLSSRIVKITEHDKTKRIVKGTFAFRAIDIVDSCKDTVTITDGFFDMHY
jgi:hypothetical protein